MKWNETSKKSNANQIEKQRTLYPQEDLSLFTYYLCTMCVLTVWYAQIERDL